MRRYIDAGALAAFQTPGSHWRIPSAGLEAILKGTAQPSATASLAQSSPVAATKARLEDLLLQISEEKALGQLEDLRSDRVEKTRRKAEAAQTEEEQLRRTCEEDRAVREQRRWENEREQSLVRARREFEDEKVSLALSVLPLDVPEDVIIDVTEAVQQKLPELYQGSDEVVDRLVIAIARKVSRPYLRSMEAEKAAGEAHKQLSFLAKSMRGQAPTDWELRAKEQAIAAISKLPETASFPEMAAAAHVAGKLVNREYEHSDKCSWAMLGVRRLLPVILPYSSPEKRTAAEEACSEAFARLPIGASDSALNALRDAVLVPFLAAEAEAKTAREAAAAKVRHGC